MKSIQSSVTEMQPRTRLGKTLLFMLPALLVIGLSALFAADFWEKKTYYEWSDKECAKMLTDSPWAWELKLLSEVDLSKSDATEGQQYISYLIQLRSALPIRQAMVRQGQIANKYDSLSNDQKQAFDKNVEAFLNADYSDKVVINVAYSTNIQRLNLDMMRAWQSKTMDVLKNSVFLYAGKGEKAKLLDFKVAQGAQQEFQFIFPREVEGKPVLTEKDKSLTLEFSYPVLETAEGKPSSKKIGDGRGYAEFKTKKMVFNGSLAY
jgi:hypothetical protein